MKLLHLSTKENSDSILKNGLIPSNITLEHHYEAFKRHGMEESKCVYTWDPNKGQSTDKYIRDMMINFYKSGEGRKVYKNKGHPKPQPVKNTMS